MIISFWIYVWLRIIPVTDNKGGFICIEGAMGVPFTGIYWRWSGIIAEVMKSAIGRCALFFIAGLSARFRRN
ncbi:hypothetical protein ABRZ24_11680 [Brenneria populi]|uniref:Uncharacterized protein n=1 Tax=Brenneria populi TaxID=1505588 RepID=A0ABU6JSL0_9GAMM|nr:hypothetical protein [Brenneria populi Li et al. 2015]